MTFPCSRNDAGQLQPSGQSGALQPASSEPTETPAGLNRREFLATTGAVTAGLLIAGESRGSAQSATKKEAVAEKVIHEAFNYQEILKTKEKEREEIIQETKKAIRDYLRISLCPYIQENEMGKLIQNIDKWDNTKGYILLPVITDGRLSTLDLRHMIWNVGKRLGWNGNKCATFIKVCFPIELKDLEIETIRRNLRQRGNCIIDIDIPECGDYKFHLNHPK